MLIAKRVHDALIVMDSVKEYEMIRSGSAGGGYGWTKAWENEINLSIFDNRFEFNSAGENYARHIKFRDFVAKHDVLNVDHPGFKRKEIYSTRPSLKYTSVLSDKELTGVVMISWLSLIIYYLNH